MPNKESTRLESYRRRAGRLVLDRRRLVALIGRASSQLREGKGRSINRLRDDARVLLAMVEAWYRNEYRVETSSIVTALAGLIYFVVPTDAIPDFLLGFGLIDDAAVLAYVVRVLGAELTRFRAWQRRQTLLDPPTATNAATSAPGSDAPLSEGVAEDRSRPVTGAARREPVLERQIEDRVAP